MNLSFLNLTYSTKQTSAQKSPKKFELGLGILAALNDDRHHPSNPIPILNSKNLSKGFNSSKKLISVENMELCEEYTCVTSHVGDKFINKGEYFEADILGNNDFGDRKVFSAVNGIGLSDFLNSCFLCGKMLHGLDIFMYRGEKAFCSAECRHRQISIDEQNENCHSEARKPMEYSVSPCAGTLQFFAGVAAA
ncbi:hypothetical protein PHJA_000085000 [Phtheirospermum japonicum]|uniref:FLZ-type domain-containing protein n=1 Tax=Phtheirospermum japonicum TaxID=374723 RepID=A0A830B5H2_9LAMI|nr:hypothetical protein PHJA_000085000 [Phtheirospermum japonicum]